MKLAEVTVTKAMPVKETLLTAMPDSATLQGNRSSGIYQGKSRVPAEVCNRETRHESETGTTMEIRKW